MNTNISYHAVVKDLFDMIHDNRWGSRFEEAFKKAKSYDLEIMSNLNTIDDYYKWLDDLLYWVPNENSQGKEMYEYSGIFYFVLDQPSLLELQNKIEPHDKMLPLTPLSQWIVKFQSALGEFMDTPESLTPESEKTFYESPTFNMSEALRPRGGWKSFNQMFARSLKPGRRPIAAISDQTVIVSPADATFMGQWEIREDSEINVKGLIWQVMELMEGSPYQDRFKGGYFAHSFLNTMDYHRQHTPVAGRVLESRIIQGTAYMDITAIPASDEYETSPKLKRKYKLNASDSAGYQFMQTRGLIVLDTPVGLVAVLPIGMAQVSSVILTAEVGQTLRKGEEISYFQFGGSDIVLLFEAASNVSITAQPGVHYRYGTKIADAYPVIEK